MKLSDIQHDFVRKLMNVCLAKATLAINGAGAATIKTTGTSNYINGGLALTKAALAAVAFAVNAAIQQRVTGQQTFYVQPISSTVYYVVALDAAGTVYVIQGTYTGQSYTPFAGVKGDSSIPGDLGDLTPIGCIKIVTNGATTFTPGTTALDAAGLTVTFTDLALIPATNP